MAGIRMKFLEIPAISILNQTIVIAHGDQYETLTIDNNVPHTLDLIELITENYNTIYLTDINGLTDNSPQIKIIKSLIDFCEVWLDAGVTNCESTYDLLVAGAQEVIISSKMLENLLELAKAYELSENLIFELDYSDGILSPNPQIQSMTPIKLANEIKDLGMNRILFADLGRIGTKKDLERYLVKSLVDLDLEVYVGGGVKYVDISMLKKLGVSGAIIELTDVLKHGKVDF